MKVKMLKSIIGPEGKDLFEGEVYELPNDKAISLIKNGWAVEYEEEKPKKKGQGA